MRAFSALLLALACASATTLEPLAARAQAAVYAPTHEGRRAAYEGALFLRVPVRNRASLEAAARRYTGKSENAGAILSATPHRKGRIPAEVRIPFRLLLPAFRLEVLGGLFPGDRRTKEGWEHAWKAGPMGERDGWDSLARWFGSSDGVAPDLRKANGGARAQPRRGDRVLVPNALLHRDILAIRPEGGNEEKVLPETPPATKPGKGAKTTNLPEKSGAGLEAAPPPPPVGPPERTLGPPAPSNLGPLELTEVPMEPAPEAPGRTKVPAPAPAPEVPAKPPGRAGPPKSGPGLPPPPPAPAAPSPASEEEEEEEAPALEYGKDGHGAYALYRIRRGEALYSAVAVRFTGRLGAAEVNEMAFKIARRSGIEDVTTIPVGYGVKIPLEDLLPDYLPREDRRYKAWVERKAAAAKFTNTYKSTALEGVVVILDAGHGGLDRGAIQNGVWEDSYVYDIACRIHEGLETRTRARVLMTLHNPNLGYKPQDRRELPADRGAVILTHPWYVPEENSEARFGVNLRWYLANQYFERLLKEGVDPQRVVFTSLHADSLHPSVRGAMFYVPGSEYRRTRWSSKGAVYDTYAEYRAKPVYTATEKELERSEGLSHQFARCLERSFRRAKLPVHAYGATRDHVVRGGKAWVPAVIRNSAIPCSLLMEVCNLNNAEDAKLMKDPAYRQAVAEAYIAALVRYYS